jgi:hypothetical protein
MIINIFDISLICLGFSSIILTDFIVIEFVPKLIVFSLGNVWLRMLLILIVVIEDYPWYLAFTYPQGPLIYPIIAGCFSITGMCLYHHMILEQIFYWMSEKLKIFATFIFFYSYALKLLY